MSITIPEISFLIPAKNASSFLKNTLASITKFLETNYINQFEIILILNGDCLEEIRLMEKVVSSFLAEHPCPIRICYSEMKGKGAALRTGFLASSGKKIFFTDADLPYELNFFIEANTYLNHGYHLVTGNRRFLDSRFTLPVSVLPLAYGRHRIGLLFNKVVCFFLGINSSDTQAGIKAFSREIAEKVFNSRSCPGFLFDIEFFLVASQNGFKNHELPVHLFLNSEKTTVRLLKETHETFLWLSKIYLQKMMGKYRFESVMNLKENYFITADDWGLSPSINRGILSLVKKGVITRVSILADGKFINDYLDELKSIHDIELGVHFNLTYENYFSSPLNLMLSMFNPFKRNKFKIYIENELVRQFKIVKDLNIEITYADGHHHCHIFPGVLNSFLFSSKIILLAFSLVAKRKFKREGIGFRPFFYPQYSKIQSSEVLRNLLVHKLGYEIITHPSDLADLDTLSIKDSYNHERVQEYYLFDDLVF